MISYKCPNCGRVYNYGNDEWYQCMNCRYTLKKAEEVTAIKHPELNPMLNDKHVIGRISNSKDNQIKCPYCHSTDTKKITNTSKAVHTTLFGIFSIGRNSKQWHCNKCSSDF